MLTDMLSRFVFVLGVVTASLIPQLQKNISSYKAIELDDPTAVNGLANAHQSLITHTESEKVPHFYVIRFKNNVSSEDAQNHMKEVQKLQKIMLSSSSISQNNNTLNTSFGYISSYHNISDNLHLYIGCFTDDVVELLVKDKHVQYVEEMPVLTQDLSEPQNNDDQSGAEEGTEQTQMQAQRRQYDLMAKQPNAPWHLRRINQKTLKDFEASDTFYFNPGAGLGVNIYILDSGVSSHTDLQNVAKKLPHNGDVVGHGTCVASLVAGHVCGVAKNARIVPIRVLTDKKSESLLGVLFDISEEILKEHKSNMKSSNFRGSVVNMSLRGPKSKSIDDAVEFLSNNGIHVVAAAGNDKLDACATSPGNSKFVTTVGALDSYDRVASFSNFGECVNIWAPGVNVLCADRNSKTKYKSLSGTSLSSPILAGILASFISYEPSKQSQYSTQLVNNPTMMRSRLLQFSNNVAIKGLPVAYISTDFEAYESFYEPKSRLSKYTLGLFG